MAIAIVVASIGIIGFMTTSASENNGNNDISSSQNFTGKWMDVHCVGIYSTEDSSNNNNNLLYLATHNGLFKKEIGNNSSSSSTNTSGWIEVGNDKSDLMGFTIDPSTKGVMYSSGHPQTGVASSVYSSNDDGDAWMLEGTNNKLLTREN